MRFLFMMLLSVFAVIFVIKRQDMPAFKLNPVEPAELKFKKPLSKVIYTSCVTYANNQLGKALEEKKTSIQSYPQLLTRAKAECRCLATNKQVLSARELAAKGLFPQDNYNKVINHFLSLCAKHVAIEMKSAQQRLKKQ